MLQRSSPSKTVWKLNYSKLNYFELTSILLASIANIVTQTCTTKGWRLMTINIWTNASIKAWAGTTWNNLFRTVSASEIDSTVAQVIICRNVCASGIILTRQSFWTEPWNRSKNQIILRRISYIIDAFTTNIVYQHQFTAFGCRWI